MANLKNLFILLVLLLNSCAHVPTIELTDNSNVSRKVANDELISAEELFKIKATTSITNTKSFEFAKQNALGMLKGIEIVFIHDSQMPSEEAFRLEPTISSSKYVLKIFHSTAAISDEGAFVDLMYVLGKIKANFVTPKSVLEVYFNAKEKDFTSLIVLAKLRREAAIDPASKDFWQEVVGEIEKMAKVHMKEAKAQTNARKVVMDALDKASHDQQLRTLVAKNDRKGAVKLIKAYLPWEQMPPFEKQFWENHLAIMADPLPLEQRVIIYRGIEEDVIQVAMEGGKELSKEEAIKEQKIFLMSTMMTKNQGTWNRRLRSLTSMYDKFIATDNMSSSEYTRAARISTMFTKHSTDPMGSPFLSLTPNSYVAEDFGHDRLCMFFVDPRQIYYNFVSNFTEEVEFLLPLVTFPDELAAVHDNMIHGNDGDVVEFLEEKAIERLNREYGGKGKDIYERINANSKTYFKPAKNDMHGALLSTSDFFKKNLGVETGKVAKQIGSAADIPCMDLIQLFWK